MHAQDLAIPEARSEAICFLNSQRPVVAVIMAGGPGERLWPLSRPGHPKPLVAIEGETLVGRAYQRALHVADSPDHVYLIALEADRQAMLAALPDLDPSRFLGEPMRRDTGMAALTAAHAIALDYPDAVLAILPADHIMRDETAFTAAAVEAVGLATDGDGICLLGAVPTGPRQEFGYIVPEGLDEGPRPVDRFVEKPDVTLATELVEAGALWNMGVFIGDVRSLIATAEIVAPALHASARDGAKALRAGDSRALAAIYEAAVRQPFDRAVLEHATDLRVVPCDAGWSDLGNWPEFVRYHQSTRGDDGGDGGVFDWREPGSPPLQVLGAEDMIICSTPAGSLVATLEASALVRPPRVDGAPFIPRNARVIDKPWGAEYVWAETDRYAGKLLFVRAGHSLSLQYHERKMESMWVLAGAGTLEVDGHPQAISPGNTITILPGTLHRLTAQIDLSVLEVSSPELDDVVRVQDVYGRA